MSRAAYATTGMHTRPRVGGRRIAWLIRSTWLSAVLVGLALSLAIVGYLRIFQSIFGPSRSVVMQVLGVTFLCAALGPWAARRLAVWLLQRRLRYSGMSFETLPVIMKVNSVENADSADLPWLLQSVLGVTLGVLMLAGLIGTLLVSRIWEAMEPAFFWTSLTESVCLSLMITLVVGGMAVAGGIQIISLYSIALRMRGRADASRRPASSRLLTSQEIGITGFLLFGGAVGFLFPQWAIGTRMAAEQWILLGSVACFAVTALSAYVTRSLDRIDPVTSRTSSPPIVVGEEWSANGNLQLLTLASMWVWGISTGLWLCSGGGAIGTGESAGTFDSMGWALVAMAVGAWATSQGGGRRKYSLGGYGVALWLIGVLILITVSFSIIRPGSTVLVISRLLTCVMLGHALPYGRRAFVARSVSERQALAQWMTASLFGCLTGVWASDWFRMSAGSAMAASAAACLLLLISGGMLQIHEDAGVRRVRVRRLAAVFASLGLSLLVLPTGARREAIAVNRAELEYVRSSTRQANQLIRLADLAGPGSSIVSLGNLFVSSPTDGRRVLTIPWNSRTAARAVSESGGGRFASSRWELSAADRWWRHARDRYDLILQGNGRLSAADATVRLSWEWFEGLRNKLQDRGVALVELPVARMNAAAVESVARTFGEVFCDHAVWLVRGRAGCPMETYLLAIPRDRSDMPHKVDSEYDLTPISAGPAREPSGLLNTIRSPSFESWRRNSETSDIGTTGIQPERPYMHLSLGGEHAETPGSFR